jgi:hypothetical protein
LKTTEEIDMANFSRELDEEMDRRLRELTTRLRQPPHVRMWSSMIRLRFNPSRLLVAGDVPETVRVTCGDAVLIAAESLRFGAEK